MLGKLDQSSNSSFFIKERVVDTAAIFDLSIWHRGVAEARSSKQGLVHF